MKIKKGSVVVIKSTQWTRRHFGIDKADEKYLLGKSYRVEDHDHDSVYINNYYIHKKDVVLRSDIKIPKQPFRFDKATLDV